MPCKPIACPPSMKQPIAKLTVITTFALHALSTGPRAYGTCILHAIRRPECSKNSCYCFRAHLVHQFALNKCIPLWLVVLTTKQQCDMPNTPCSAFCKQYKTCCPNDLHGLQAFWPLSHYVRCIMFVGLHSDRSPIHVTSRLVLAVSW